MTGMTRTHGKALMADVTAVVRAEGTLLQPMGCDPALSSRTGDGRLRVMPLGPGEGCAEELNLCRDRL
jgi:hypothetical protein